MHRHGSSGPSHVGAGRSLQTLLSRQHLPAFGARVCMHPRIVAGPHDSVRENRSVAVCCGKLQWSDDGDSFTSPRSTVSRPECGEPHSPVFLHHNSGRTLGRLSSLPAWKRAQMPVDGCLTEMKSGYRADVEAAKLRSLLARRHVEAGHFGQVLVAGVAGHLSPQVADWHDLKDDLEQYEYQDEWSSGDVQPPRRSSVELDSANMSAGVVAGDRTVEICPPRSMSRQCALIRWRVFRRRARADCVTTDPSGSGEARSCAIMSPWRISQFSRCQAQAEVE